MGKHGPDAAQKQHYVPRHLLRGFLSSDLKEAAKEQVRCFDLQTGKVLPPTNISNVMSERRYNDLLIDDDTLLTIEPGVGKVEEHLLPLIRRLRSERKLDLSAKEHQDIALLLAFQFVRSKKMRELMVRMDDHLRHAIERRGGKMSQVQGYEELSEERIKRDHTRQQIDSLHKFTDIMAEKVFFLAICPPGTSLYISDNPVVMANDEAKRPWGAIGIGVPFIQIYMPLARDLMLCAYSKEVLGNWLRQHDEAMQEARKIVFDKMTRGEIPATMMKKLLTRVDGEDGIKEHVENVRAGRPILLRPGQVDKYNSLQAFYAVRWVIDSQGDFKIARKTMPERAQVQEEIASSYRTP